MDRVRGLAVGHRRAHPGPDLLCDVTALAQLREQIVIVLPLFGSTSTNQRKLLLTLSDCCKNLGLYRSSAEGLEYSEAMQQLSFELVVDIHGQSKFSSMPYNSASALDRGPTKGIDLPETP